MANTNISIGPTIQFNINEALNTLVSLNTSPMFSYFTLASGVHHQDNPMANGILVVRLNKSYKGR